MYGAGHKYRTLHLPISTTLAEVLDRVSGMFMPHMCTVFYSEQDLPFIHKIVGINSYRSNVQCSVTYLTFTIQQHDSDCMETFQFPKSSEH